MAEQPVPLQQDTLSTLPGGGIRTITATVMINDVPTQVQMQVVALADPSGALLAGSTNLDVLAAILDELREIKSALRLQAGVPDFMSGARVPSR